MRSWLTKIVPRTLSGQLLVLLGLALLASLAVTQLLFIDERAEAGAVGGGYGDRRGLLDRIAAVGRMLDLVAPDQRAGLAEAAGSPHLRFWISDQSGLPPPGGSTPDGGRVIARDIGAPSFEHIRDFRIAFVDIDRGAPATPPVPVPPPPFDHDDFVDGPASRQFDLIASLPFHDRGWLNAETHVRAEKVPLPLPSLISAAILALAGFAIVVIVARRVTRPLKALADSADAFGRGVAAPHLTEVGPDEARRLIAAFNRMQERLSRFVADRTRMLAAIGHDLRTPITSLKLRAELLDDEEAKTKMLATLDEMEHMTEATLAFAREDATSETSRTIDLAAAIASQVDDLAELGKPVSFGEAPRLVYSCRPTALKRAIGNLIENAVQYGRRARISLEDAASGPVIAVEDDGPGIPEERLEEVFKPFVRLETSRNRTTGGTGLGLAIARSIVLGHGGELVLSNRREGGLRAEIRLPAERTA
jgi:signal transduction histidine kinase